MGRSDILAANTMQPTTAIEKLTTSALNTLVPFFLFLLVFPLFSTYTLHKLFFVGMFFAWNGIYAATDPLGRFYGMNLLGTTWERPRSSLAACLYLCLYTVSFSTLLFYYHTPFDLFLLNMFLIQLPMVCMTKTTLHGWLCGVRTVRTS